MIQEIQARTLLSSTRQVDGLFGIKYTMNLYRGCQHQCIYCDSRSECYQIANFSDVLVKVNAIDLLRKELPSKRVKGAIGTGSMNDPYMPLEARYRLTARALAVIAEHHFPVHVITKSALVLRDLDVLQEIARVYAAVSVTITTADDDLARKLEPCASAPSDRFAAIKALNDARVPAGITMMPILPFIEDNEANIVSILQRARDAGVAYILPWFGMSMRDRQRRYYYEQLDRHFPGLRQRYEQRYGEHYECPSNKADALAALFRDYCERYDIPTHMKIFTPVPISRRSAAGQLSLFR